GVEGAAAGDEPQLGARGVAVDALGREPVLRVALHQVGGEHRGRAVGAGDGDLVARLQLVEPLEDTGRALEVDVPRDDGRAGGAGGGGGGEPAGGRGVRGHLECARRVDAELEQRTGAHTDGGDAELDRGGLRHGGGRRDALHRRGRG